MKRTSNLELIFGLVAPIGVDLNKATSLLTSLLETKFEYNTHVIKLSDEIQKFPFLRTTLVKKPQFKRINTFMNGGNEIREKIQQNNTLAALAIGSILRIRNQSASLGRTVFILSSLKHPDEVGLLRGVYGEGFFLFGFTNSDEKRTAFLTKELGCTDKQATILRTRDEDEKDPFGQHTREVFRLADAYFNMDDPDPDQKICRILKLIFSDPFTTPLKDEYAMYLATASSLRSGDLSRQVGAVIMSEKGDIISTGTNDVPKFGGGLYWEDDTNDKRDLVAGQDSNHEIKHEIVLKLLCGIKGKKTFTKRELQKYERVFSDAGFSGITEYGRAVHAEMEALISCARSGVSTRGATLYSTTFPCHNCAKHIVAAGIVRVVFIEPYPKSKTMRLHDDSIVCDYVSHPESGNDEGVRFEPFVGLGPRKFIDLFSLHLSRGNELFRKNDKNGVKLPWTEKISIPRLPLKAISYIESEKLAFSNISNKIPNRRLNERKERKKRDR